MSSLYDIKAHKKATNLTINSDLLAQAKELKINISSTLEVALAEALKEKKTSEWKKDNKKAIVSYNEAIEEFGLFSDGMRIF